MEKLVQHYQDKLACEIDSADLKAALESGQDIVIIDARSPQAYQAEHLPGAVNMPHRTMTAESTQYLDNAALIVTYCDGIGCNASTKGALNMARLGFRVRELIGGLDWWKRDGYRTSSAAPSSEAGECGCN